MGSNEGVANNSRRTRLYSIVHKIIIAKVTSSQYSFSSIFPDVVNAPTTSPLTIFFIKFQLALPTRLLVVVENGRYNRLTACFCMAITSIRWGGYVSFNLEPQKLAIQSV